MKEARRHAPSLEDNDCLHLHPGRLGMAAQRWPVRPAQGCYTQGRSTSAPAQGLQLKRLQPNGAAARSPDGGPYG
jgi:hypothetical protein